MSDLDTQIRDYAHWLADTADAASEAHAAGATPPPAGRPRWPRRGALLAAAAAVVVLVVGLAMAGRAPSDDVPADPPPPTPTSSPEAGGPTVVTLADGYELTVVGEPEVVDEVEVWQGAQAPPMAAAADDLVGASSVAALLEESAPSQVVLPEEFTAEGVERVVTVGEIGDAVVLAHAATRADADRDVRCVLVAPMNDSTDWLSGCGLASPDGTQLGLGGGFGQWIVWTDIPAEAALVELRGTGGASIHQHPIARTVAFPIRLLDGSPLQLVAYDSNGDTIASPSAPGASPDDGSSDTSEIGASATPFAVTGRSRSFIGQAPADARTDPTVEARAAMYISFRPCCGWRGS